jgi:hypothetical protein
MSETPYEVARRLQAQGVSAAEIERTLGETGLDEDEVRIVTRAACGASNGPASMAELPPSEPPSHPCPTHPQWPVAATCGRCGKFFCQQCVRDAGLAALPESKQCPDCERTHPKDASLAGIGGWLLFPAFQIATAPLVLGSNLISELRVDFAPAFLAPLVTECVFFGAGLVYSLVAAVYFFRRRRHAVPLMIGFYVLGLIIACMNVGVAAWVAAIAGTSATGETVVGVMRAVMAAAVWVPYFVVSKRVKQTFTR